MQQSAQQHAARHGAHTIDPFPLQQCARDTSASWPRWCVLERGHEGECSLTTKWWRP